MKSKMESFLSVVRGSTVRRSSETTSKHIHGLSCNRGTPCCLANKLFPGGSGGKRAHRARCLCEAAASRPLLRVGGTRGRILGATAGDAHGRKPRAAWRLEWKVLVEDYARCFTEGFRK
eukprot:762630-Hanusia_phi.AAC.2